MIRTIVETCRENCMINLNFLQNKDPKQSVQEDDDLVVFTRFCVKT